MVSTHKSQTIKIVIKSTIRKTCKNIIYHINNFKILFYFSGNV